jgi:hypothetical protein
MLVSVSKDHMSEKQFYEQVKRIVGWSNLHFKG